MRAYCTLSLTVTREVQDPVAPSWAGSFRSSLVRARRPPACARSREPAPEAATRTRRWAAGVLVGASKLPPIGSFWLASCLPCSPRADGCRASEVPQLLAPACTGLTGTPLHAEHPEVVLMHSMLLLLLRLIGSAFTWPAMGDWRAQLEQSVGSTTEQSPITFCGPRARQADGTLEDAA
jgi:hypothetical protein